MNEYLWLALLILGLAIGSSLLELWLIRRHRRRSKDEMRRHLE
jgi:hypothetical protein